MSRFADAVMRRRTSCVLTALMLAPLATPTFAQATDARTGTTSLESATSTVDTSVTGTRGGTAGTVDTSGTGSMGVSKSMGGTASPAAAVDVIAPAPRAAGVATASPLVAQGVAYEHGEGVPKDPVRAAALYCEAARAGDNDALFNLGWMYANGRGIPRDYDVAASLFARAAAAGHAQAGKVLGLFRSGQGALPDCLREAPATADAVPYDIVRAEVDPFGDLPAYKQRIADVVNKVAPAYGIEPRLALAVISVESNFDHMARSDRDARGLMQLIPETALRFKVRNAFDIRDNVRGGLSYLRWLLAYYRGEVRLAAAAYNAGEGAVDRYKGVPPYAETRDYVKRVMQLFRNERHPYDPSVVSPSPVVGEATRR